MYLVEPDLPLTLYTPLEHYPLYGMRTSPPRPLLTVPERSPLPSSPSPTMPCRTASTARRTYDIPPMSAQNAGTPSPKAVKQRIWSRENSSLKTLLERYMRVVVDSRGCGLRSTSVTSPRLLVALLRRAALDPPTIPSRSKMRHTKPGPRDFFQLPSKSIPPSQAPCHIYKIGQHPLVPGVPPNYCVVDKAENALAAAPSDDSETFRLQCNPMTARRYGRPYMRGILERDLNTVRHPRLEEVQNVSSANGFSAAVALLDPQRPAENQPSSEPSTRQTRFGDNETLWPGLHAVDTVERALDVVRHLWLLGKRESGSFVEAVFGLDVILPDCGLYRAGSSREAAVSRVTMAARGPSVVRPESSLEHGRGGGDADILRAGPS
ncbi:hypothetical protein HYPSUDRAFT_204964 [Hypholoma sublateritium FD-334 SS-4]|uniref:Uncharacterized protein n=1 Tax=Hypholoma sublateritium (strain FD-334 SS-4) TaxID=945553 RepID=A0A0D2PG14_HYPSF|nr:hypothetical protein HYPSUDRAFT_204964 [Hypholoma sublateritium FD-334 SS-4]